MSFKHRRIDLGFQLGEGSFSGGGNTADITGKRVSASIRKSGGISLTSLDLRVYGLSMDLMNTLSTLGKPLPAVRNNVVTVKAGDDDATTLVFQGIIQQGWADLQSAPDGVFVVQAFTGLIDAMKPVPPTSFNGPVDAAQAMSGFARMMGLGFINDGVSGVMLSNAYFPGTAMDQAQRCAQAANINLLVEHDQLVIWPKGQARQATAVVISPDTGLVGYPGWTAQGVSFTTEFNPTISYGGTVVIEGSLIEPANGPWSPFAIDHDIESETPGGRWFTRCEASVFGSAALE